MIACVGYDQLTAPQKMTEEFALSFGVSNDQANKVEITFYDVYIQEKNGKL